MKWSHRPHQPPFIKHPIFWDSETICDYLRENYLYLEHLEDRFHLGDFSTLSKSTIFTLLAKFPTLLISLFNFVENLKEIADYTQIATNLYYKNDDSAMDINHRPLFIYDKISMTEVSVVYDQGVCRQHRADEYLRHPSIETRLMCLNVLNHHCMIYKKIDYYLASFVLSPKFTIQSAIKVLHKLSIATRALHDSNLYHLNIAPQNIAISWLDGDFSVTFLDLFACGKPYRKHLKFTPPELLSDETAHVNVTQACDTFSLGMCFLFVLLEKETFKSIGTQEWRDDALLLPPYKRIIASKLVRRMLNQDPTERPSLSDVINSPLFWSHEQCEFFLKKNISKLKKLRNFSNTMHQENILDVYPYVLEFLYADTTAPLESIALGKYFIDSLRDELEIDEKHDLVRGYYFNTRKTKTAITILREKQTAPCGACKIPTYNKSIATTQSLYCDVIGHDHYTVYNGFEYTLRQFVNSTAYDRRYLPTIFKDLLRVINTLHSIGELESLLSMISPDTIVLTKSGATFHGRFWDTKSFQQDPLSIYNNPEDANLLRSILFSFGMCIAYAYTKSDDEARVYSQPPYEKNLCGLEELNFVYSLVVLRSATIEDTLNAMYFCPKGELARRKKILSPVDLMVTQDPTDENRFSIYEPVSKSKGYWLTGEYETNGNRTYTRAKDSTNMFPTSLMTLRARKISKYSFELKRAQIEMIEKALKKNRQRRDENKLFYNKTFISQ